MRKYTGFTLIEILIALFIFAIISVMLSYGLNSVFSIKNRLHTEEENLNTLQMGLILMQRDMTQMVYLPVNPLYQTNKNAQVMFNGTNTDVTFVSDSYSNPLGEEQRSNLQLVAYHADQGQLTRTLWNDLYPAQNDAGQSRTFFKVSSLKFQYLSENNLTYDQWPPVNFPKAGPPKAIVLVMDIANWGTLEQVYNIRNEGIDSL